MLIKRQHRVDPEIGTARFGGELSVRINRRSFNLWQRISDFFRSIWL